VENSSNFLSGAKDAVPIVLGYLPLGLAFGGLARVEGLSPLTATLMSIFIYSGSGQFILVALLAAGSGLLAIVITVLLVNLRYLLLSASLATYTRNLPRWFLALIAAEITDESYAVGVTRFSRDRPTIPYLLGLFVTAHLSWITGSCLGAILGGIFGNVREWGLDFALTAMFICLLVWQVADRQKFIVALLGVFFYLVLALCSQSFWNIIVATILASVGGMVCEKWIKK
jgi:4-azaleucine resistance transporter AzlC